MKVDLDKVHQLAQYLTNLTERGTREAAMGTSSWHFQYHQTLKDLFNESMETQYAAGDHNAPGGPC